ncbi:MAG: phosphoadenylyl-sulfate reductase [Vicinamibacteria bacterium]|nr:phosphoadenylyl-sulfate reductase [Vicinamibacteria bacterium]
MVIIGRVSAADLNRAARSLEGRSASAILAWAFERFAGRRLGLTSAFGPEGCALIDLAMQVRPDVPIYTIDTGHLFAETIAVREAYRRRGANVVVVEPSMTLDRQAANHGPRLYERDPDQCCAIRKVEPMRRLLAGLDVWITAIRRDQSAARRDTPIVGTVPVPRREPVVKIAPLAAWTRKQTWAYLVENDLPYNPLLDRGYTSIGCAPCTQVVEAGAGERDGRWAGHDKSECGIHSL